MPKIFLVEDDIVIRTELCILLKKYGYECSFSDDFEHIVDIALQQRPQLILLDVNLPYYDGHHICRSIRKRSNVPIIIVTSRNRETDELISMNIGADDFIIKPYYTQILLARIASVLRRTQSTKATNTIEYIKKQQYYKEVMRNLIALDKKFLLAELIDQPSFAEGNLLYNVLQTTAKSMNDNIALYKISSQEYREYIETWVHEIKTPIAASKLIIENNKSALTKSLEDELNKIDAFVEQALFYSKSNTVEKDYSIKAFRLNELVKHSIKKHSKALIESKINISLEQLDFVVYTDSKWIDFILGQINVNSMKYKTSNPELRFYAKQHEQSIILSIQDNGIGICENDLSKVFEKGFTGKNGRIHAKSTGIGLYLCKKLCDKMGLNISVFSDESNGVRVDIVFPKNQFSMIES